MTEPAALTNPFALAKPAALVMSASDWLLLVALSILWGGSFYFSKVAVMEIPPLTLALGRVCIAAVVLTIVARAVAGPLPRDAATWWALIVMAMFNNALPFALIFWSQLYLTVGLASILNATTPLFGVLIAHFMTVDDKLTAGRAIGLGAGLAGVVMLIGPDLLHQLGTHVLAEIAGLAAACAYGFSAVYARRLRGLSPLTMASGQLTVATVMLIPLVVLFERPATMLAASAGAIAAMVSLALLSTALAYVIYFRLIRRAGASNTVLTAFLIPVSAILLGVLLLGETITPRQLAGMAAIAAGLAAIDGRPARMIAGWFGGARTSNKA